MKDFLKTIKFKRFMPYLQMGNESLHLAIFSTTYQKVFFFWHIYDFFQLSSSIYANTLTTTLKTFSIF